MILKTLNENTSFSFDFVVIVGCSRLLLFLFLIKCYSAVTGLPFGYFHLVLLFDFLPAATGMSF